MTETEFFQELDKILLSNTSKISELIDEYYRQYPQSDHHHLVDHLIQCLNKKKYHLLPEQKDELWEITGSWGDIDLIDTLLELQGGKCSSNNLLSTLHTEYAEDFHYIFDLINEYPNSYQYEPDNNLYELLKRIVSRSYQLEREKVVLPYFLKIWTSSPILQKDLNQLIYYAMWNISSYSTLDILIEFGADPFANYYEGDVDTGIPIVLQTIQNNHSSITPLLECTAELKGWNIIDEWGRNLLHYVTNDQYTYNMLLEKGVDPDHRALINDKTKVVTAKMNGTLPKEYGKTPGELVKF